MFHKCSLQKSRMKSNFKSFLNDPIRAFYSFTILYSNKNYGYHSKNLGKNLKISRNLLLNKGRNSNHIYKWFFDEPLTGFLIKLWSNLAAFGLSKNMVTVGLLYTSQVMCSYFSNWSKGNNSIYVFILISLDHLYYAVSYLVFYVFKFCGCLYPVLRHNHLF